ncbi:hypothetical protein [Devosia indica]
MKTVTKKKNRRGRGGRSLSIGGFSKFFFPFSFIMGERKRKKKLRKKYEFRGEDYCLRSGGSFGVSKEIFFAPFVFLFFSFFDWILSGKKNKNGKRILKKGESEFGVVIKKRGTFSRDWGEPGWIFLWQAKTKRCCENYKTERKKKFQAL